MSSKIESKLQGYLDKKELEKYESKEKHKLDFGRGSVHSKPSGKSGCKDNWCGLHGGKQDRINFVENPFAEVDYLYDTLYNAAMDEMEEAVDLLISKHLDYGSKNITDAPGGALNGLSVRLHDKVARLNNLLSNNKTPNHESLKDTFVDIVNYGIIALLVINGKWDSTK